MFRRTHRQDGTTGPREHYSIVLDYVREGYLRILMLCNFHRLRVEGFYLRRYRAAQKSLVQWAHLVPIEFAFRT